MTTITSSVDYNRVGYFQNAVERIASYFVRVYPVEFNGNRSNGLLDESNILGYLLSHSNGQGKAAFFLGFDFQPETWTTLVGELTKLAQTNPVAAKVDSTYGTRHSVDRELQTPSGKRPRVQTDWILERDSDAPRLITAYPA